MSKKSSSWSASSCILFSAPQKAGRRKIELQSPSLIWLCRPILTLSSTVSGENRRMFWNVRAMPSLLAPAMSRPAMSVPSSMMEPRVGW